MSKKNKKQKVRDIVIDADHILHFVCFSNKYKDGFEVVEDEGDFGEKVKINIDAQIKHLESIISDYVLIAEVESICYGWTTGETKVIFGDKTNFRYKLLKDYKANRADSKRNEEFYALQDYCRKKYTVVENCEADDVVAYYVRKGGIGFSTDKDILKSEGIWFDCYHSRRHFVRNSKKDAYKFMLMQCLVGDATDNIKGLYLIGHVKAKKLLDEYGWSWESVKKIYVDKGKTVEDAILTRNLVDMTLWHPKKGIRLINE
jgi:5'-3' exonuclease